MESYENKELMMEAAKQSLAKLKDLEPGTDEYNSAANTALKLYDMQLKGEAQESTRYCNYSKEKFGGELTFIWPSYIHGEQYCELNDSEVTIKSSFLEAMTYAEKDYKLMLANGMRPEQARCVLPLCLKTEIVVTANYREWRNIFKLRTPVAAHPQMRELMCPLLKELQSKIPVVFDDIYTEDDQTRKGSVVARNAAENV